MSKPLSLMEASLIGFMVGNTPKEMETKLAGYRERIQRIGDVNLGAINEYEDLKARFEFLSSQQEDCRVHCVVSDLDFSGFLEILLEFGIDHLCQQGSYRFGAHLYG